ncbi:MAG TPA: M55 family metallopeptidase [Candidatus Ozemobacteraceae bacterium]|nr:M55 family metallopeptidase [Candidatus Ozemobacteraceae bacterium]
MKPETTAPHPGRKVLLLTDIEGSSGCFGREGSLLGTPEWAVACRELSRDADAVVRALFDAGATRIWVQDFHRTGFNLLRELIDRRAVLRQGYRAGPVPGIGAPPPADTLMMIGFHAASGTTGFLPHTLTSRFARLRIDGRTLCEAELFAGALGCFGQRGMRARLFSGCPVACAQAHVVLGGIRTVPIDKSGARRSPTDIAAWRVTLARTAAEALDAPGAALPGGNGPFRIEIEARGGEDEARRLARAWHLERSGATVSFTASDRLDLFHKLSFIAYLKPWMKPALPLFLRLSDIRGRSALDRARASLPEHGS